MHSMPGGSDLEICPVAAAVPRPVARCRSPRGWRSAFLQFSLQDSALVRAAVVDDQLREGSQTTKSVFLRNIVDIPTARPHNCIDDPRRTGHWRVDALMIHCRRLKD